VRAVDVGIGRENNFVIAQFRKVKHVADSGAERHHQVADLLRGEHFVEARALNVEDLAAQRQVLPACGGRGPALPSRLPSLPLPQRALTLGVFALAVGELARERHALERTFAQH
jgi:hypothetical protein